MTKLTPVTITDHDQWSKVLVEFIKVRTRSTVAEIFDELDSHYKFTASEQMTVTNYIILQKGMQRSVMKDIPWMMPLPVYLTSSTPPIPSPTNGLGSNRRLHHRS